MRRDSPMPAWRERRVCRRGHSSVRSLRPPDVLNGIGGGFKEQDKGGGGYTFSEFNQARGQDQKTLPRCIYADVTSSSSPGSRSIDRRYDPSTPLAL